MIWKLVGVGALLLSALVVDARAGTIQAAIDAATDGDVVVIEPGTYAESIDFGGKAITVRSADGPEVTIIDASGLNDAVVRFVGDEDRDTVLEGFTITGGLAASGAGVQVGPDAAPTIVDCRIADNDAIFDGAGCFNNGGAPRFIGCTFVANVAANGGGGGLVSSGGAPEIVGCRFDGNGAVVGGGLALLGAAGVVRDCLFRGNGAAFDGGAVYNDSGVTTGFVGCLFTGNVADGGGGGAIVNIASHVGLTGCTFSLNEADFGGAIGNSESNPLVENCILWGNTAPAGPQLFNSSSTPVLRFCDIEGSGGSGGGWDATLGTDGGGNLDADPLFVDADGADDVAGSADDDTHLQPGSPCIDAGDNAALDDPCGVDLDGDRRRFDDPAAPDVGAGAAPIVDIGADEHAAPPADCNGNGLDDVCDLDDGTSLDCNDNGLPDECDLEGGSTDLNDNGVPDECEPDCNRNGVPDELDIDGGGSTDLNDNGVPDECEADCNRNGVPDEVDLAEGTSGDCNNDAVPDECNIAAGLSDDEDGDGVPDECAARTLSFTPHVVADDANGALAVFVADLDGDGDLDLLSASRNDDRVAWYENDGLAPPAFTARTITASADGAADVTAADLDGDGDLDVLVASRLDDRVTWFENLGGDPIAFVERVIATDVDAAVAVTAADLDGDDDLDVVAAGRSDAAVRWFENDGARPPAFTAREVSNAADGVVRVATADLDGDRDVDVLAAAFDGGQVWWFENAGGDPPAFAPRLLADGVPEATSVAAVDLDGDGNPDALSTARGDHSIRWHESDGGTPPSFTTHVIASAALGARMAGAADLDGDGDLDVVAASVDDDTVSWFERLPGDPPQFAEHIITIDALAAQSVVTGDVDGDGDLDVVTASRDDDRVAWYEADGACCPADITGDGVVDVDDLIEVILGWGPCPPPPDACPADVDDDGDVDVDDLIAVILAWTLSSMG